MTNAFLAGFGFRTKTPSFETGQEIECMVTGRADDGVVARIGDTILRIDDAPPDAVDTIVRARVTEFDETTHRGTAEYLATVGTSSF
jgi:hypothetical protein